MAEKRPIPGWPGYEADTEGNIYGVKHDQPLKSWSCRYGHLYLKLCVDKRRINAAVHRLILETFVGPCPEGMECCHNNGDPEDNRAENLRWDTPSANTADRIKHGTSNHGERNGHAKLTAGDILKIRNDERSQRAIGIEYGVSRTAISAIKTGRNWSHVRQGG